MKIKLNKFVLLVIVMLSLFALAFTPMPGLQEPGPVLTEAQLVVIGLVASALLWVLRVLASYGYQPKKEVVAIALYVISFGLAVSLTVLTLPPFPPFSDAPTFIAAVLAYVGSLLQIASPVAGIAYLVYNLLLKRVLESMFPVAAARVRR